MALPLPTLTWAQTTPTTIAGAGAPTPQQVLNAIETAVSGSTYWRVITSVTQDGVSGNYYLEIAPKVGSAIANFRVLLYGGTPTTGSIQYYNTGTTRDAASSDIWVSVHPDGDTLLDPDPGNFTGAYARATRFWPSC
jgi:hypothetical protein